ncbi:MAG: heparan-alpha-glucosaminide N-acetyltransferase [Rhizobiaceae bacterium]
MTATAGTAPADGAMARLGRIDAIDLARAVALIAMAVYHFTWDLEFFGYVEPGLSQQGGWKIFARAIASSFLVLVGISLVLAHGERIRWAGFGRRLAQIVAAAAAITIATRFAIPERFIFFGILHQIALASVIGLAFLRLPAWLTLAVAVFVIAAPHVVSATIFGHPALWWVGLAPVSPLSNDYVPVFPWTGAMLAGIAGGRLMRDHGLFSRLAQVKAGAWATPLRFIGRHSLAFYLLHQPLLIGALWLYALVLPATPQTPEAGFMRGCQRQCETSGAGIDCALYCACVLDAIDEAGRLDDVFSGVSDDALKDELSVIAGQCSRVTGE